MTTIPQSPIPKRGNSQVAYLWAILGQMSSARVTTTWGATVFKESIQIPVHIQGRGAANTLLGTEQDVRDHSSAPWLAKAMVSITLGLGCPSTPSLLLPRGDHRAGITASGMPMPPMCLKWAREELIIISP